MGKCRHILACWILLQFVVWAGYAKLPTRNLDSLREVTPTLPDNLEKLRNLNFLALRLSARDSKAALQFAHSAVRLGQKLEDPAQTALALNARAVIWRVNGDYQAALEDFRKALQINQQENLHTGTAQTLNGIGALYMRTGDYTRAYNHFAQAYQIQQRYGTQAAIAVCLNNMGNAKQKIADLEEAIHMHEEAVRIERKLGNAFSASYSLHSLGEIATTQQRYQDARAFFEEALKSRQAAGNLFTLAETQVSYARLLILMREYPEAAQLLEEAERYALQVNASELYLESLFQQAELAYIRGRQDKAAELFRRYARQKDSIFNTNKSQQFERLRAQYQLDRTEQENASLKATQLLKEKELRTQQNRMLLLVTVLVLVSALAFVFYRFYQNKQRHNNLLKRLNHKLRTQREEISSQSERLREANAEITKINANLERTVHQRTRELQKSHEELEFYLYHSAHDLRRPITSIKGLVHIAELTVSDQNATELFKKVDATATQMLKMIQKLNMLSEIKRLSSLTYEPIHFEDFISKVLQEYQDIIEEKEVRVEVNIGMALTFYSDTLLLRVILKNLIENALLFTPRQGTTLSISVRYGSQRNICIRVRDEGIGIQPAYQKHVFDLYFRATEASTGNGIGLYLVRQAVEQLKGEVSLESTPEVGTSVEVTLPIQVG